MLAIFFSFTLAMVSRWKTRPTLYNSKLKKRLSWEVDMRLKEALVRGDKGISLLIQWNQLQKKPWGYRFVTVTVQQEGMASVPGKRIALAGDTSCVHSQLTNRKQERIAIVMSIAALGITPKHNGIKQQCFILCHEYTGWLGRPSVSVGVTWHCLTVAVSELMLENLKWPLFYFHGLGAEYWMNVSLHVAFPLSRVKFKLPYIMWTCYKRGKVSWDVAYGSHTSLPPHAPAMC